MQKKIFSKKSRKCIVSWRKVPIFAHLFRAKRDGEKKPTVLSHHAGITQLVE